VCGTEQEIRLIAKDKARKMRTEVSCTKLITPETPVSFTVNSEEQFIEEGIV